MSIFLPPQYNEEGITLAQINTLKQGVTFGI